MASPFDAHSNLGYGTVLTAPSPALSGTTIVLGSGQGATMPSVGAFQCIVWPAAVPVPTQAITEVIRATRAGDTLTIVRAQETSAAIAIGVGYQVAVVPTNKTFTDIEQNIGFSPPAIFGDGADGSLNFDGAATILGMVPSANVYTLSRSIYATDITVGASATIKTNGFRIHYTGTLTNAGIIQADGNVGGAGSNSGSAGSGGAVNLFNELPGNSSGSSGGGGTTTTGGNGGALGGVNPAFGGAGGKGGNGGTGNGGGNAGGTGQTPGTYTVRPIRHLTLFPIVGTGGSTSMMNAGQAGSGGGAGGGSGAAPGAGGGGGGGGGGFLMILGPNLVNNGTIRANGGIGGVGGSTGTANCGGGGGGGGGGAGVVILVYKTITVGTIQANGGAIGALGTGGAGGAPGTNGAVGSNGFIMRYNMNLQTWE